MTELADVLGEAMGLLEAGVRERDSPFRTPTLASMDAAGGPDLRSVVLRAFDVNTRTLAVHSDSRAAKVAQIRANPAVSLHVWDASRRLQLRLQGRANLHAADSVARAAWHALSPPGRRVYCAPEASGAVLADPMAVDYDTTPEQAGFSSFVVIAVAFDRLETLRLIEHGQLRARFDWCSGALAAAWLVP